MLGDDGPWGLAFDQEASSVPGCLPDEVRANPYLTWQQ